MSGNDKEDESFRYELARVLASRTFSKASKQRDLLRWLVEHTLSEDRPTLSQYAIATDALGYPRDYDPTSGGVRIAIRRLREKLGEYYANEGRLNRFRIEIEKEQYEPKLVASTLIALPVAVHGASEETPVAQRVAVLVLPFLPVGFQHDTELCAQLTLGVMRALAASGQARVVPWSTSHWIVQRTGDKREYHRATGADVILEALVQKTGHDSFKVGVQWIDGLTGLLDTFVEVSGGGGDRLAIVDDIATKLCHRLNITYDERTRSQVAMRESSDAAAAGFYLQARDAALVLTPDGVGKALRLVAQALKRDPYFAAAHALAAEVHVCIGDTGMASAIEHAPLAREAAQRAHALAPDLGDAFAANGAVELVHDWNFPRAEETLQVAVADVLAENAPHWPPILDIARGRLEEAAIAFEAWTRLDPGSTGKAALVCEFWYYARQFEHAITWGLKALERDPYNLRAGVFLADCYVYAGRHDEGLRIARKMHELAPDFAETNLVMVMHLARAGKRADAWRVLKTWEHGREDRYVHPVMWAMAYGWLGETTRALDAMRKTIANRHTVCLVAGNAPYLEPLHGLPEFNRMLADAGLAPAVG